MMNRKEITSFNDLYTAIRDNEITFAEALGYVLDRESESWKKGYSAAADLYGPIAFPNN